MYTEYINIDGKLISVSFLRDNEKWTIPIDDANKDYQEYIAWLRAGNRPTIEQVDLFPSSNEPTPEERLAALELVVSMVFGEDDANV